MVRTQIQLPDELYARAHELAEAREISMAELVRRGLELLLSQYPEPAKTISSWRMPKPLNLGWRGLSDAEIKNLAQSSSFESETTNSKTTKSPRRTYAKR